MSCTFCTMWFLRRGGSTRITPGMYGYGKMPYVVSSQRDSGQTMYRRQQPRSPSDYRHSGYTQEQQKYKKTQQSSQNSHHSMSQGSWIPLHQPSSGLQPQGKLHPPGTLTSGFSQASVPGRPHNPSVLPASSCSGVAIQYKMCNMNVREVKACNLDLLLFFYSFFRTCVISYRTPKDINTFLTILSLTFYSLLYLSSTIVCKSSSAC